jgi:hypothetical protein
METISYKDNLNIYIIIFGMGLLCGSFLGFRVILCTGLLSGTIWFYSQHQDTVQPYATSLFGQLNYTLLLAKDAGLHLSERFKRYIQEKIQ